MFCEDEGEGNELLDAYIKEMIAQLYIEEQKKLKGCARQAGDMRTDWFRSHGYMHKNVKEFGRQPCKCIAAIDNEYKKTACYFRDKLTARKCMSKYRNKNNDDASTKIDKASDSKDLQEKHSEHSLKKTQSKNSLQNAKSETSVNTVKQINSTNNLQNTFIIKLCPCQKITECKCKHST